MNEVSYTKYIEVYYDMMNRYVFECDKLEIWNRICMKTMSEKIWLLLSNLYKSNNWVKKIKQIVFSNE